MQIAKADELRKAQKWAEAEKLYAHCLNAYALVVPVEVYKGLTICLRMLKKYEICEKTLNDSLKIFPNHVGLMIEYAALYNNLQKWDEASFIWSRTNFLHHSISDLNVHRSAKAFLYSFNFNELAIVLNNKKFSNWVEVEFFEIVDRHKFAETNHHQLFYILILFWSEASITNCDKVITKLKDIIQNTKNNENDISGFLLNKLKTDADYLEDFKAALQDIKCKDYVFYLLMSNLFLCVFDFKNYKIMRDTAKKLILQNFDQLKIENTNFKASFLIAYIGVLAEIDSLDRYKEIGELYKDLSNPLKSKIRPPLHALRLIYDGGDSYMRSRACTIKSTNEKEFLEYVRGKRIAVVGPIDTGLKHGEEIDGYDVVIRFNFTQQSLLKPAVFGSRTDVSYYTNPAFKKVVEKESIQLIIDWVVPQSVKGLDLSKCKGNARSQYRSSNSIFFKSFGNAFQRLLLDLLIFNPKEVKLFNMNFWITPHDQYYKAARASFDPHTVIYHDILSNYIFILNLYRNKTIKVDRVIEDLLAYGEIRYNDEMHSRYYTAHREGESIYSRKKNPNKRSSKVKLIGLHIRDTKNIGDKHCHPLDYFRFGCSHDFETIVLDINKVQKGLVSFEVNDNDILIVGGGAIARKCQGIIKKTNDTNKLIAWGVGYTQRNKLDVIKPGLHYNLRSGFALYGCRDYMPYGGVDYVPCVSCMHQFFDNIPEAECDVVVYSHHDLMSLDEQAKLLGFPHKTNKDEAGLIETLRFLSSGKIILTSSYHGAYWGTLLGRKVAMIPFGTKFMNLKFRPPVVRDLKEGVEKAVAFPGALNSARRDTQKFYKRVMDLIWKT